MGYFCDGRASLVVGTHTHVPTADLRVLPGGTAFVSDVGMTGDYNSVIGMAKDEPLQRFLRKIPAARFEPASGPATLCAVAVETRSRDRPCRARRARCASAARWRRRGRRSGLEVPLPIFISAPRRSMRSSCERPGCGIRNSASPE